MARPVPSDAASAQSGRQLGADHADRADSVEAANLEQVRACEIAVQGAYGALQARLYQPVDAADTSEAGPGGNRHARLVVLLPGCGFAHTEFDLVDYFARLLAAQGTCCVLVCSVTPASERPFPAAAEDAHAILAWTQAHRKQLNWSGKRLIVAGIEAGGNLAAAAAMMARDRGHPALAAQILIMPMLDPGLTTCSMRMAAAKSGAAHAAGLCAGAYQQYLPRAVDRTHPYASPLRSSRMKGLAPALILAAEDDPLFDEAQQYGTKLTIAGIRTSTRRLPPIAFSEANARCKCARQEVALREIRAFLDGLDGASGIPKQNA